MTGRWWMPVHAAGLVLICVNAPVGFVLLSATLILRATLNRRQPA
jgi:hypothetical protein